MIGSEGRREGGKERGRERERRGGKGREREGRREGGKERGREGERGSEGGREREEDLRDKGREIFYHPKHVALPVLHLCQGHKEWVVSGEVSAHQILYAAIKFLIILLYVHWY